MAADASRPLPEDHRETGADLQTELAEARRRETLLRSLVESSSDCILCVDGHRRVAELNQACSALLGFGREELLGADTKLIHVDEEAYHRFAGQALPRLRQEGHWQGEWEFRRQDGEVVPTEVTLSRLKGLPEGHWTGSVAVIRDLRPRRAAEASIRETNRRLRDLLESLADGFFSLAADGTVTYFNRAAARIWRRSPEEVTGRRLLEAFPELADTVFTANFQRAQATGQALAFETHFEIAPYQNWYSVRVYPQEGGISVFFQVTTERHRAEEALSERGARLKAVTDNLPGMVYQMRQDPDNGLSFTYLSERSRELLGVPPEQVIADRRLAGEVIHPDDRAMVAALQKEAAREQRPHRAEYRVVLPDGSSRWLQSQATPRPGPEGSVVWDGVAVDITELKQAERELAKSEERWRRLLENIPAAVTVHDDQDRIVVANKRAQELLGLSLDEMLGKGADHVWGFLREDLTPLPPAEQPVARVLEGGKPMSHQVVALRRRGRSEPAWLLIEASPLCGEDGRIAQVIVTAVDISERKQGEEQQRRMEAQLQQVQKLESLGVLAGGIAHDFNNLLMGVLGNAGLALMELPPESPVRDRVERIEATAQHLAGLTNQLLAYAGKGRFVVKPLDFSRLVKEVSELLKTVVSKRATLRYQLSGELPSVEADASQMRQVILNLITNASEALGGEDGIITVATGWGIYDHTYLASTYLHEGLPDGCYVFVEVSDTGCGMDAETRARIFDPFFSTKFAGRGLGLAAVMGIVRGHRGAVKVYSEPGKGTAIKVLFPGSSQPAERLAARPAPAEHQELGLGVLVVDDEEMVRDVLSRTLGRAGCRVLTARDGQEGVEVFTAQREAIDLVILDMTMPRMNGEDAFRAMRLVKPEVQVLLSSGYNEQDATNRFAGKGLAGFIQKPYTPSAVLQKIREIMPRGRRS